MLTRSSAVLHAIVKVLHRASNSSGGSPNEGFQSFSVEGIKEKDMEMRGTPNRGRGSLTAEGYIGSGRNTSSKGVAGGDSSSRKAPRSTAQAPALPPLSPGWQK